MSPDTVQAEIIPQTKWNTANHTWVFLKENNLVSHLGLGLNIGNSEFLLKETWDTRLFLVSPSSNQA